MDAVGSSRGLWVTVERAPEVVVGGLGQVSETVPDALQVHLGHDVDVVMPYLKGLSKSDVPFESTGEKRQVTLPDGKTETFELLKQMRPGHSTCYAIKNDRWANSDNIYTGSQEELFTNVMLYNRGAHAFLPVMAGPKCDFVVGHDWLTSPLLAEMGHEQNPMARIFFLHNTYDQPRSIAEADNLGLHAPENVKRYSPLQLGIQHADAVIANKFYVERLTHGLAGDADFVPVLKAQLENGRVFDMHHGLSDLYKPDLPASYTLQDLANFKQENLAAVQKQYGLKADPQATLFSWVARPEPYQKGFYLVMDQMKQFLEAHPKAQLLMAGINLEKAPAEVQKWVGEMQNDPNLAGRVSFPGFVNNHAVVKIAAGSSFLMLPSLYEPYGLSQLEAMRLGALPIVHPVDGLKATVADLEKDDAVPEHLKPYGSTGIFTEPLDVPGYWKALDGGDREARQQASTAVRSALERAMALPPDTALQMRANAMRFVEEQHNWQQIAQRYVPPIEAALAASRVRL